MSLPDSKEPRKYKVVCFLLLVQIATAAANGVVKMRTFRAVNGYNSTVATCYKLGVNPNLNVRWMFDGHPIDVAADNRFLSSVRIRSGPSTHFYLDTKPALSSDNNTAITCQPDGEKESASARLIVYDSAPIVEAIGDGFVKLLENSLFRPQVRIDFQGGRLNLIYFQNGKEFQPTPVDGVHGTKDVLLTPIRVDATMNGPLSIIAYMDGFRFTYNIFRLIVVNQTADAAFYSSSPSSHDGNPTTNSIGDSGSSSSSSSRSRSSEKSTTLAMTPSFTSTNARLREATIATIKLTPAYLANKDTASYGPFTQGFFSLDDNSKTHAVVAGSVSGIVFLLAVFIVALVVIHKSRNKISTNRYNPEGILETTSPRRQPQNASAPSDSAHTITDSGLAQCSAEQHQKRSVTDLEQSEANIRAINERDGGSVSTQAAHVDWALEGVQDNIIHRIDTVRAMQQQTTVAINTLQSSVSTLQNSFQANHQQRLFETTL